VSPAAGPHAPPPVEVVPHLPEPVRPPELTAILGEARVPEPLGNAFTAVSGESQLPPGVGVETFEGAVGGADLRMGFPGGGGVFMNYTIGVPLGAEKPVVVPRVRREESSGR